MKNLKGKILALSLSIALLVCGIIAVTASAETASDTPTVAIKLKNVSFTSSPTLAFAVEHTNCDAADLTMTVINVNDENDHFTVKSNETVTISGTTYPVFYLNRGIDPKNVAEEYLVYVSVDGTEVKSDVVRYSILQFALEGMLTTTDAAEYARYESIVTYAKSIQEWLAPDGKFTGTPADEYFYIKATGAKDVVNGIYSGEKEITLEYDTTSLNAEAITGWKLTTNNGGVKSTTVVPDGATVTISESTEITPAFAPVETFDNGLGSYVFNISSASRVNVQNGELVMSTDNGAQDYFRIKFMNDAAYKTYIFQSDIYVDFDYTDDSDVGAEDNLTFNFRNASNSNIISFSITKGDTDGTVKISLTNDYGKDSAVIDYMIAALTNNTFNLKVEYYYFDTYAVAKFYINGALAGVRNVASAEVLDFIQPTTTTASEFLAKFDNVSLYKSDKAYVYQTPGIYENFENGAPSTVTKEITSGATAAVETVVGADGESTKAYVLNKTAAGNDKIHVKYANKANTTSVYQADMKFDHVTGDAHLTFYLGTAATTGDYAYRLNIYYSNGVLNIRDRISTGTHGATVVTDVKDGDWFNFRLEYTEISDTEILVVVYINGEAVYVSDNYYTQTNNNDDCTWPISGPQNTHLGSNGNTWATASQLTIGTNSTTQGTFLDDIIYVDCDKCGGIIAGDNERSVLIAVYEYLKSNGCRWLYPGADGEYIPMKGIDPVKVRHVPRMRYRGYAAEGGVFHDAVTDFLDFMPKVGLNTYMVEFRVPRSYYEYYYKHFRNYKSRPEEPISDDQVIQWKRECECEIAKRGLHFHDIGHGWTVDPFGIDAKYAWEKIDESLVPTDMVQYLAEIDGKRGLFDGRPANTQFCMSNPKARKMFVDFVVKYAEDHSNIDYLHVWLADNVNNHCECSECCKKIPSDYYVVLMNDLDKALSAKRLDTKIVFIAYLDTIYPPELEKIENSSRFSLLIAPISRCYSVPNTIRWYAKSKCKTISSIGALDFFKAENAPEGATERCQDCPHKDTCPYSAYRIYIERWHQFGCPTHEWPYNVVTPEPVSEEKIRESIESGPYGRCVFHCDNNVVDHQTVQMLFENGITATFHMNAFNLHGGRRVTMFGTYGEVYMDEKTITLDVFGKPTEVISIDALLEADYGHGGGDLKLVEALYDMMEGNAGLETSLEASVESHLMGIKAEESRLAAGKLLLVHN